MLPGGAAFAVLSDSLPIAMVRFAIATGRAEFDPTAALKGALAAPVVRRRAAIVEPKAFGGLLRAIAGYEGGIETRISLELLALTFVRPGELRAAEWKEFDLDAGLWEIPAEKTKMRRPIACRWRRRRWRSCATFTRSQAAGDSSFPRCARRTAA